LKEALGFYRKACDLGASRGCGWVAAAILDGVGQGSLKDALSLYVRACRGGMGVACRQAAGLLYLDTVESRQLAAELDAQRLTADLLTRGCKLGDREACDMLAKRPAQ
jgi:TPR repeat protein